MREFFQRLAHELEGGRAAVLVSILCSGGSTPRGAGSMMAVLSDGTSFGTVGGGAAEWEAQLEAARLLRAGENAVRDFRFVPGDASGAGMVCGGSVTLHFHCLDPADPASAAVFRELTLADGRGADAWFVRRLDGAAVKDMGVADRNGTRLCAAQAPSSVLGDRAVLSEDGWFAIPAARAGRVWVFGGGHVARALVPVIARVGFRPAVFDDRPEFADAALFPDAAEVLCGSFGAVSEKVHVTQDDYVVIMTRGHQADYETLTQTLRSGARYLGCIGSATKLALCRKRLLDAGFTAEEYAALHAPIGLAIGAQTPEEIAVSVAAELIAVRSGVIK